jgi:hypothetical protein
VNPFDRTVEIYRLTGGEYAAPEIVSRGVLKPQAFPGLEIEVDEIWPKKQKRRKALSSLPALVDSETERNYSASDSSPASSVNPPEYCNRVSSS